MRSTRKILGASAAAGVMVLSAVGIANAASNGDVQPADEPSRRVTGTVEQAPSVGSDAITVGG